MLTIGAITTGCNKWRGMETLADLKFVAACCSTLNNRPTVRLSPLRSIAVGYDRVIYDSFHPLECVRVCFVCLCGCIHLLLMV